MERCDFYDLIYAAGRDPLAAVESLSKKGPYLFSSATIVRDQESLSPLLR